ncbi:TlpA family protein disulfide reductase [Paraflavitalea pollutisoli]|uniref:TlpA family protein disulfide reductase n=1 Tax=Paraflavitalea pollutisoli TaxID=3034143 RepID=UPI0023EAF6A3|nr:TlpA disulfide reductase family protein [Paraflavitalea sp. H1-2-19X]
MTIFQAPYFLLRTWLISLGLLASYCTQAQDITNPQQLITQVLQQQSQLNRLAYTVRMVDTFVDGTVRNLSGFCDISVDPADKLFGFSFRGQRTDLPSQLVYTGGKAFYINTDTKTYAVDMRPGKFITGHPGGQVLFPELVNLDTTGHHSASVTTNDSCYILRLDYPDLEAYDVSQRYKLFYIDKRALLPVRSYWHQSTLGKRQVITRQLLSISFGENVRQPDNLANKQFLEGYTLQQPKEEKPAYLTLLGKPAPAFQLTGLHGGETSLASMAGKVILLDFWAVWCAPCIESLPKVNAIQEKYKSKGLEVVGILTDTSQTEAARRLLTIRKIAFRQLMSNGDIEKQFKAAGIPHYVLIDRKGTVSYVQAGFIEVALQEAITKALAE